MVYDILQGCKKTIMPSLLYTSYYVNTETLKNILNYACEPFSFFFFFFFLGGGGGGNKCCSFNQVRKKRKKFWDKEQEVDVSGAMAVPYYLCCFLCVQVSEVPVWFYMVVHKSWKTLLCWSEKYTWVCVCVVYTVCKCIFSGVHGWAGGGVYTCSDSCCFLLL